ncbi:LCP family protein [Salibacterium aidingense]|uniref:LCP family protein n=1 Tax=Salibacterium aidingense TaxID=384933 RepID=UPI003BE075B8
MWKTALAIFITVLLTIILAGAGYAYYLYDSASEHVQEMNQKYTKEIGEHHSPSSLTGPVSFLLVGIGDRPGEQGLADTIIGASVNPEDESMLLFNIPRDTKVDIPGHGGDKINHSYSYGGTKLLKETAENQLNYSFDFVVEADMEGFTKIVDVLGGVEVNNPFAFSQDNIDHSRTFHFEKGVQSLNGEEALQYVRMRKNDPRGDLGRNERQREVLASLLKEGRSMEHLLQSQEILSILQEHVKTNVTMKDLRTLFTSYRSALDYIRTFELEGENIMEEQVSYYRVPSKEWEKASLLLENHHNK